MKKPGTLPIRQLLTCLALLGLLACAEESADTPGAAIYGKPVMYLQQKGITFPDFSLHYLGKERAADADRIAYDADRGYLFEITNGKERTRVAWNDADNTKHYERFAIGGNFYFLQLKSSHPKNRALKPGELVVLDFVQFQKNNLDRVRTGTAQEQTRLAQRYRAYRQALQHGDWKSVTTFLSSNRIRILEQTRTQARLGQKEILQRLIATAPQTTALDAKAATLSSTEARLHLATRGPKDARITGVLFVKEDGDWKIERETTLPANKAGMQWIKIFLTQ